jgi:hypothetical protein
MIFNQVKDPKTAFLTKKFKYSGLVEVEKRQAHPL